MSNKEKLRAMIRELGEAISDNLIQSDSVQNILRRIKDEGYHVDLSLAIGVCLYKEQVGQRLRASDESDQELKFEINEDDLAFLNSLRITLDKENKLGDN
jgi:hypothetical protein